MSYQTYIRAGFVVACLLIVGLFGWAAFTPLSGAVIATGTVSAEGEAKQVQHLEGGIIKKIFVKEGQFVDAGELLIRLDDTQLKARMDILENRYYRALAEQARLKAERDKAELLVFASELLESDYPLALELRESQESLFRTRKEALEGEKAQLKQQIVQLEDQQEGQRNLIKAKRRQLDLIQKELVGVRKLYEKGHAPYTRLLALEREQASIEGEVAEHQAQIARMKSSIGEIEIKIIQSQKEQLEKVLSELKEITAELNEVIPEMTSLSEQLRSLKLVSPVKGYVHELTTHTEGGVVTAATPLMQIIPSDDRLIITGQVMPQDIDQIYLHQEAVIKLSAFDQKKTPDLFGRVLHRSADHIIDPNNQQTYFEVKVEIPAEELKKLTDGQVLMPGMPAEAYIQTAERTALDYLLKPLVSQWHHALQEE